VHNEGSAATDTKLVVEDVETLNISMMAGQTNNAQVLMADMEAPTINVTGGAAGALLTMGTLDPKTTALNASGSGEVSFTVGAQVTPFTFTSAGHLQLRMTLLLVMVMTLQPSERQERWTPILMAG
jgi:hypothetical protein